MIRCFVLCFFVFILTSSNNTNNKETNNEPVYEKGSYGYDAVFLKKHAGNTLELENGDAKILLSAAYQGRVFTSTAAGDTGTSFGWINYKLLEDSVKKTQFNPVGGEERFWLGREGGQYSIYFKKNDPFDFAHWQVPALIDTVAYKVDQSDKTSATISIASSITDYTGTTFDIAITRSIHLLDKNAISEKPTILIPEIHKDGMYVNSKWELQKQPFSGDVIKSYNDGALQDGSQMGPFYEIESSSPAKELKPGEIQEYHQTTIHLQGAYSSLKTLVQQLIHVDLEDVKKW